MRALYCFDLGTPVDRIERVVGEAGLDAVILGSDLADHDRLRDGLAGSSVDVVINVPVFFDPVFLPDNAACYAVTSRGRRAVEGWLHFACPSSESYWRYRTDRVRRQLERLAPIDPVMITFDFARTFVFWETVRPGTDPAAVVHGCYCATCRQRFHEASDHHVPDEVPVPGTAATCAATSASCSVPDPDSAVLDPDAALAGPDTAVLPDPDTVVLGPDAALAGPGSAVPGSGTVPPAAVWGGWRAAQVTRRIAELSGTVRERFPGIPLGVKLVPWLAEEFGGARLWAAGQDLASLARLVDVVMPMTYSFMTGSPAGHIAALCDELRTTTGKPVMPSLQADNTYREGELPMAAVEQMLDEVERSSDGGYSVFHLESLADRPELRRLLASRAPA